MLFFWIIYLSFVIECLEEYELYSRAISIKILEELESGGHKDIHTQSTFCFSFILGILTFQSFVAVGCSYHMIVVSICQMIY